MTANDASPVENPFDAVADSCCATQRIVELAFRRSSYIALREVQCRFVDGVLTLRGEVPTYFLKQLAQSLAAKAADSDRLINLVQVADADLARTARHWRFDGSE